MDVAESGAELVLAFEELLLGQELTNAMIKAVEAPMIKEPKKETVNWTKGAKANDSVFLAVMIVLYKMMLTTSLSTLSPKICRP